MTVAIYPNPTEAAHIQNANYIAEIMCKHAHVLMAPSLLGKTDFPTTESEEDFFSQCQLILVLGGDGTMLWVARRAAKFHKPILGINMGRLGFLTGLEKETFEKAAPIIANREFNIEQRIMLDVTVYRQNQFFASYVALNDAVLSRASLSRVIGIKVNINDEFLDKYFADGIIVSTPTGSTAYALSTGGPVIKPTIDVLLLCPICPHDLRSRPIVLGGDDVISLELENFSNSALTIDGQDGCILQDNDRIYVKKSHLKTGVVKIFNTGFYEILRNKL